MLLYDYFDMKDMNNCLIRYISISYIIFMIYFVLIIFNIKFFLIKVEFGVKWN